jgi:hypothetical protein
MIVSKQKKKGYCTSRRAGAARLSVFHVPPIPFLAPRVPVLAPILESLSRKKTPKQLRLQRMDNNLLASVSDAAVVPPLRPFIPAG